MSESQDSCGHFEPKNFSKISPIGRLLGDFRTWKDRKVLLQKYYRYFRKTVEHFLTVDYASLAAYYIPQLINFSDKMANKLKLNSIKKKFSYFPLLGAIQARVKIMKPFLSHVLRLKNSRGRLRLE